MPTYRIVPKRGTYRVEQVEPNGESRVLRTWRTEEEAVSHMRRLELKEHRATHRPLPGEVGGPPMRSFR